MVGSENSDLVLAARDLPTARLLTRLLLGFGLLLAVGVVAIPIWASLSYRSAVHDLHRELASVEIDSATIVDAHIDRCWNGVAPASVRTLVPTGDETLSEIVGDYVRALGPLGFTGGSSVVGLVADRARVDDLDGDLIHVSIDDENGRVTIVADPYDSDMVTCLPF